MEVTITTNKMNHLIDPHLEIWGWEIPVYLFLGGLTAGILVGSGLVWMMGKQDKYPALAFKLPLWGPVLLSLGMGALFLDLEYKMHVWRFYTAFKPLAPMSWGSWILLIVYPINIAIAIMGLEKGYPYLHKQLNRFFSRPYNVLLSFLKRKRELISQTGLFLGIALGIYTGILLGSYVARPAWNSAVLGPLFLASGISAALALGLLVARDKKEILTYAKWDAVVIGIEVLLLGLLVIQWSTSGTLSKQVSDLVFGGVFTAKFWAVLVGIGLFLPAILELFELRGRHVPKFLAPSLALFGGIYFRFLMVEAGQMISWVQY